MTTAQIERTKLSQIIRDLPDEKITVVLNFIEDIFDDEPLTEEDIADLAEADADIAAGRVYAWEDVEREMAALPL
ncbi:hypothetical protein FACS1894167_12760 [Synergistales bacterium]|nr:hypothetical protein FACS1894167_12760 [Synergistales bacterium]